MNLMEAGENLKDSCVEAIATIDKLKKDNFNGIKSKIEWCIGSYENDKNPAGLHESCVEVLHLFTNFKKENPRKISKKTIEKIEKSIKNYEAVA